MDKVFIQGLLLKGKHGVHEKERQVEQEFIVDISADCDTRKSAVSDALEDTVNYSNFVAIARELVEKNSFYLIEKLADSIAKRILEDKRISSVTVTIKKPAVYPSAIPGVTIVRTQ